MQADIGTVPLLDDRSCLCCLSGGGLLFSDSYEGLFSIVDRPFLLMSVYSDPC